MEHISGVLLKLSQTQLLFLTIASFVFSSTSHSLAISPQRFSIGLISQPFGGQSRRRMEFWFEIHSVTILLVCMGDRSWTIYIGRGSSIAYPLTLLKVQLMINCEMFKSGFFQIFVSLPHITNYSSTWQDMFFQCRN